MPTIPGWSTLAAAALVWGIARVLGVGELMLVAAALLGAVVMAVLVVAARPIPLVAQRFVHPTMPVAHQQARVELSIANRSALRTPPLEIDEAIGEDAVASFALRALRPRTEVDPTRLRYRLSPRQRGILEIGPLVASRSDVLGLARRRHILAERARLVVVPETIAVTMPRVGLGDLGRELQNRARRFGHGEFHALRDYVAGDEPRSIHWRASARTESLKVRQLSAEVLRRCLVVLDRDRTNGDDAAFERSVTIAASLVASAAEAGLATRFVTAGDIDLRGPDVARETLIALATIDRSGPLTSIGRTPGDGLGLVIIVAAERGRQTARCVDRLSDPTLVRLEISTAPLESAIAPLQIDAGSIEDFISAWASAVGMAQHR